MSKTHHIRVIGGKWRRRMLPVQSAPDLRPTPDRLRETLFNWLQGHVEGTTCLDLFSGTGILGFEALSRGAAQALFIDNNPRTCRAIRQTAASLGAVAVDVINEDALRFLNQCQRQFGLVFLDPPYRSGLLHTIIPALSTASICPPGSRIYLEYSASAPAPTLPQHWNGIKHCRVGDAFGLLAIVT